MKKIILLFSALLMIKSINAQTQEETLPSFKKIIVSPRISVILQKGDKESIRLLCNNISPEMVNVRVDRHTLRLFLDRARIVEKQVPDGIRHHKRSVYSDVSVTAYVTYRELKELEIRGDGEISCETEISTEKLKLRAYGEAEIRLASLKARKFKASLYGVNRLQIRSGEAVTQVYRLFGENKVDTRGLSSTTASARIYGEGKLSLNASDKVRLNAIGEPFIMVSGNAKVSKGITVGRVSVNEGL